MAPRSQRRPPPPWLAAGGFPPQSASNSMQDAAADDPTRASAAPPTLCSRLTWRSTSSPCCSEFLRDCTLALLLPHLFTCASAVCLPAVGGLVRGLAAHLAPRATTSPPKLPSRHVLPSPAPLLLPLRPVFPSTRIPAETDCRADAPARTIATAARSLAAPHFISSWFSSSQSPDQARSAWRPPLALNLFWELSWPDAQHSSSAEACGGCAGRTAALPPVCSCPWVQPLCTACTLPVLLHMHPPCVPDPLNLSPKSSPLPTL